MPVSKILIKRKTIISKGCKYESCTWAEWDNESELSREIINFDDGFKPARQIEMTHSHPWPSPMYQPI